MSRLNSHRSAVIHCLKWIDIRSATATYFHPYPSRPYNASFSVPPREAKYKRTSYTYTAFEHGMTAGDGMEQVSENKCFGGWNRTYKHLSTELGCEMKFTVFYPPGSESTSVPVVMYLSGLTCTNENFIIKAGAQRTAAELGLALVAPDTSPRGLGIDGEDVSYDFGTGAGFYLDATVPKWSKYRMYSYITSELIELLKANASQLDMSRLSIMGHSMGGHGALTIGLKNPTVFSSVSAFSPICNPMNCPWGLKAFSGYLGEDSKDMWSQYDATELLKAYSGRRMPVLMDTGTGDNFYQDGQLLPEAFEAANSSNQIDLSNRMQDEYDHSYFFIASFMTDHLQFHSKHLNAAQ